MRAKLSFIKVIICFSVLAASGSSVSQSLYKCTDADGGVMYQATPCIGLKEDRVKIDHAPEQADVERAMQREARIQDDLSFTREQERQQNKIKVVKSKDTKDCKDVKINSYTAFDEQNATGGELTGGVLTGGTNVGNGLVVGGVIVGGTYSDIEIHTNRCVKTVFKLKGYGGGFNDSENVNEIASNFVAVFSDGTTRDGSSGTIHGISEGSRINLGETYTGSFCFGDNNFEIVDLQCH